MPDKSLARLYRQPFTHMDSGAAISRKHNQSSFAMTRSFPGSRTPPLRPLGPIIMKDPNGLRIEVVKGAVEGALNFHGLQPGHRIVAGVGEGKCGLPGSQVEVLQSGGRCLQAGDLAPASYHLIYQRLRRLSSPQGLDDNVNDQSLAGVFCWAQPCPLPSPHHPPRITRLPGSGMLPPRTRDSQRVNRNPRFGRHPGAVI